MKSRRTELLVLGSIVVAGATASVARADINTGSIDVSPPWVQATVNGERLPATAYTLKADHDTAIDAQELRDAPLAIALVVLGQEIWIGNDDYETDDAARYPGILKSLAAAIDSSGLAKAGPANSKVVVVTYSTGADLRLAASDLSTLSARSFGIQKDYRSRIGTDLVQGITLGLDQLAALRVPRKALIVLGDGNDTDNEAATKKLAELRERAHDERVDTFAIVYKSAVSAEGMVVNTLVTSPVTLTTVDGLAVQLDNIVRQINDGHAVLFDARKLDWDGKMHHLSVMGGERQLASAGVVLPVWDAPASPWSAWWRWVVIAVGVLAVAALGFLLRSRLRAP